MTRRRERGERGAAAVEFALVSLIMITLVASVIQFALYFWGYQGASSAAREAARLGAVNPCDEAAIIARGKLRASEAAPVVGTPAVTVTAPTKAVGAALTVKVTFTTVNIGIIPGFDAQISKSATTRIENLPSVGC